jgi:hypothetical protein
VVLSALITVDGRSVWEVYDTILERRLSDPTEAIQIRAGRLGVPIEYETDDPDWTRLFNEARAEEDWREVLRLMASPHRCRIQVWDVEAGGYLFGVPVV